MSRFYRAISFVFLAILLTSGCSKTDEIDQEKFRKIYLSAKAIDASIKAGISFARFGEKVRNLAKEISVASDLQINKKEKELLEKYDELYEIYKDSAILWRSKSSKTWINMDIIQKYPILVENKTSSKYGKPRRYINADAAMREIWKGQDTSLNNLITYTWEKIEFSFIEHASASSSQQLTAELVNEL